MIDTSVANFFPSTKVELSIAAKFRRRRVFHGIDYIRTLFVPDSPVEMPDETLCFQRHGLETCGICCCNHTFMRDVLEEQEESNNTKPESDEEAVVFCINSATSRQGNLHGSFHPLVVLVQ